MTHKRKKREYLVHNKRHNRDWFYRNVSRSGDKCTFHSTVRYTLD